MTIGTTSCAQGGRLGRRHSKAPFGIHLSFANVIPSVGMTILPVTHVTP